MFPLAHVVSAMLFNRLAYSDEAVAPAALGALIPDAVDKPLAWVLHVAPTSHSIAHTPLAAAGLSLIAARVCGVKAARSFASAYLLHLVTDELHHGRVPWLLPFSRYRRLHQRRRLQRTAIGLVGEMAAIAVARTVLTRPRAGAGRERGNVPGEGGSAVGDWEHTRRGRARGVSNGAWQADGERLVRVADDDRAGDHGLSSPGR